MSDEDGKREPMLSPRPSNVCICFHVPLNKIVNFIRQTKPQVASQISECHGAGTGCGWCIPFLERLHEQMKADPDATPEIGLSEEEYLARRREYHKKINAEKMRDRRPGE